jgi:hypothetical protein
VPEDHAVDERPFALLELVVDDLLLDLLDALDDDLLGRLAAIRPNPSKVIENRSRRRPEG